MTNKDNLARMSSVLKQLFLNEEAMNVKINTLTRHLHFGWRKTQLELSEDKFILCSGSMTYQVDGQMQYNTSELCDLYADMIDVVEPLFANYGGRRSFGGKIHTVKCFEDNGLVRQMLAEPGVGKVLLIDGGGSARRALIDAELAALAAENGWEGIVVYGSVRDVDTLEDFDIGIQAVNAIPVGADDQGFGETEVPVCFAGVTFLPDDHLYADSTGIILSADALDIE